MRLILTCLIEVGLCCCCFTEAESKRLKERLELSKTKVAEQTSEVICPETAEASQNAVLSEKGDASYSLGCILLTISVPFYCRPPLRQVQPRLSLLTDR